MNCTSDIEVRPSTANGSRASIVRKLRNQLNFEQPFRKRIFEICKQDLFSGVDLGSHWFVSKRFDLLFVCGMAPWIFGAIAYFLTGGLLDIPTASPQQQMLTILFVATSLIIGEGHQFTSIIRYYRRYRPHGKAGVINRIPIWVMYAMILIVVIALMNSNINLSDVGFLGPFFSMCFSLLGSISTTAAFIFPAVLMQHFCAQAKAVGLKYCQMQNFGFSIFELQSLSAIAWLLTITGALTIATPFNMAAPEASDTTLTLIREVIVGLTLAATSLCVVYFSMRGLVRNEWLPAGATLTWANMAIFTLMPFWPMVYVWLFVPVFFHATQHWAIAWQTQQQEEASAVTLQERILTNAQLADSSKRKSVGNDIFRLVIPVQVVSVLVLFAPLLARRFIGEGFVGVDDTLPVTLSMVVFYFHYFADRVVWRSSRQER